MKTPYVFQFTVGDRVRLSDSTIRTKRDYWQQQGREPDKSNAKRWMEEAMAERGTVTKVRATEHTSEAVDVVWDRQIATGGHSSCLTYVIQKVSHSNP